MEIILSLIISFLMMLVGVGQLLAEFKYHDKRTTKARTIRKYLIGAVILLGILSMILSIMTGFDQRKMASDMESMRHTLDMQPQFELFLNGEKLGLGTDSIYIARNVDGNYPIQFSFVNLGSKSATGVLIELIGSVDYSKVQSPWQISEAASCGLKLESRGYGFISYSLDTPVQRDIYIELPPVYLNPANNGNIGIAIKCTEKPVTMWDVHIEPK